jgi:hypothetical protein
MFDQIDQQLIEWVQSVFDSSSLDVSLQPPGAAPGGQGISLYLHEILPDPPLRTSKRAPLQVSLRYLVTTWAEEPLKAHHLLGELVFAAMEHPEYIAELEPLAAAAWSSFGIQPRPAFLLCIPVRRERPEPTAPYVSRELVVQSAPIVALHGRVVGPGDIPMRDVRVELPALQLAHYTDSQGFFHFAGVPREPADKVLFVKARGQEFRVTVNQSAMASDEPVVIRFNPPEE